MRGHMMRVGARYRYFRGGDYVVVAIRTDAETAERLVDYQRVDGGDEVRTCSLVSFLQPVEFNDEMVPRFKRV